MTQNPSGTYSIGNFRRLLISIVVVASVTSAIFAQEERLKPGRTSPATVTVTAKAAGELVRFTAPGEGVQLRLEVYSDMGQRVSDSGFARGNVMDWKWRAALPQFQDGDYLCVVTVKTLSGQDYQRHGMLSVRSGQASLHGVEYDRLKAVLALNPSRATQPLELSGSDAGTLLTLIPEGASQSVTVIAHDGTDGQVTSTEGALTFRTGDVFSGKEKEQMRITEDGRVGIGTDKPEATLDVAGAVRVSEGIKFSDGTTLQALRGQLQVRDAAGEVVSPSAAGTGTLNKLAKWAETGGAGNLTDSLLSESGATVTHNGNFFQMTGTPTSMVESNIIHVDSNTKTMGQVAGPGSFFGSSNGPYFILRGNAYSAIAGQRGLAIFSGGNVSSPVGREGSVQFNTLDQIRMLITPAGNVGIGTTVPNALLDVAGNINTTTQYNIAGSRVFSIAGTGNTFAGSSAGNANTGINNSFFGQSAGAVNTGNGNSFFGKGAGAANTSGFINSFFGESAGASNTTGFNNSFFGQNAGAGNTSGSDNSFFGQAAGGANTTGTSNSFFGRSAGAATTTGTSNSFFGRSAGASNTTGSSNSFFGLQAGQGNTTGQGNSFFGRDAGQQNTNGANNAFFGRSAGLFNTMASSNSYFGESAGALNTTGANNSMFGKSAGYSNTASNNSFFGESAGTANTTGGSNSFFGKSAGAANTSGTSNSFFGFDAGAANTTGIGNAFFGASAGAVNTAGNNSFFGFSAGRANTTGSFNSFFGNGAGEDNTTGGNNSFFGWLAGGANTTGLNNSFFGMGAGLTNTTGASNAFFGKGAGGENTTANNNSFFGASSGAATTTGAGNSFFGKGAGLANATGAGNSFFGENAGAANSGSVGNSFFGQNAGAANTTSHNSFFGESSGAVNTTGGSNAFFGGFSGGSNTTGDFNSFFGLNAGFGNTIGESNAFFGTYAGNANTTGDTNSFFGKSAGSLNTEGGGNTFAGYNSGQSNTTENNNTFVGANSNGAAGITNATAVGANASVTQSDSLVLGSGVKVGIGSSQPAEKLHVVGNVFIGGNPAAGANGLILKSPNGATCAKLTIDNAGALVTAVVTCP